MSYPHRAPVGINPHEPDSKSLPTVRLTPPPAPMPRDAVTPRALRTPLTRSYEAMWLRPDGQIDSFTRIAPATPLFEEAFSALARGAVLQGEAGPVAIEDVVPGMRVQVAEGDFETVTWVGSMTLYPDSYAREADGPVKLTRITAEAFGQGRPALDLVLGPRARICLRDPRLRGQFGLQSAFVPARSFVDGVSVIEVQPAAPVTVYHLVLARQAAIKVMGLELESYHPGTGIEEMIDPRMLSLFAGMFPQIRNLSEFGPLTYPRLTRFEVDQLFS